MPISSLSKSNVPVPKVSPHYAGSGYASSVGAVNPDDKEIKVDNPIGIKPPTGQQGNAGWVGAETKDTTGGKSTFDPNAVNPIGSQSPFEQLGSQMAASGVNTESSPFAQVAAQMAQNQPPATQQPPVQEQPIVAQAQGPVAQQDFTIDPNVGGQTNVDVPVVGNPRGNGNMGVRHEMNIPTGPVADGLAASQEPPVEQPPIGSEYQPNFEPSFEGVANDLAIAPAVDPSLLETSTQPSEGASSGSFNPNAVGDSDGFSTYQAEGQPSFDALAADMAASQVNGDTTGTSALEGITNFAGQENPFNGVDPNANAEFDPNANANPNPNEETTGSVTSAMTDSGSEEPYNPAVGNANDVLNEFLATAGDDARPADAPFWASNEEKAAADAKQAEHDRRVAEGAAGLNKDIVQNQGPGNKNVTELGDVADVSGDNPYAEDTKQAFSDIGYDIEQQQRHGMSAIEQQKQKAINDMSGVLGTRGVGTSYATMLSGLGGIESAAMKQAGDLSSSLEKQKVDQQLARANAMISAGDVEGGQKLKAEIANQATDLQQNAQGMEQQDQNFQQNQAVIDGMWANIENMRATMDVENMTTDEKAAFDSAIQSFADAQQSGKYTPAQLQQMYLSLFAKWNSGVAT